MVDNIIPIFKPKKVSADEVSRGGFIFSNSTISGQNRILNYNRSTSAYVPMTTVGSELKFDIGASERMRIDIRQSFSGDY